ncbi:MAG: DUF58 domain-containing protein [Fimbriimonadaceae bacterium]|nr:DUF58 domain-containing protein [Fimbriimonadaceae bacterium]QYK54742.1 MAG: DUF58 domain-containing protein [Fimbriimonadaceae bacterium]
MNRFVAIALSIAGLFLVVMAVLVNSPPLFYMTTAVIALLLASRLQAYLAVRGLRFERSLPPAVRVGEEVVVDVTVWSERRLRRPLVTVIDGLPKRMRLQDVTLSLPIAPSFDQPVRSRYTFRPMRRGHYTWNRLTVRGSDALGIVTLDKTYTTDSVELKVYPVPLPVPIEIRPQAGWGLTDVEAGRVRGSGLEPQGVREYVSGDPMRHIHWKSTARTGQLMVKEFESGSGVTLAFLLQRSQGTDVGTQALSTFECMCGHALWLANEFLQKGATVSLPGLEDPTAGLQHADARMRAIREALTLVTPEATTTLAEQVASANLPSGATLVVFAAVRDVRLPDTLVARGDLRRVVLVYDLADYVPNRAVPSNLVNAADPAYLARLEAAGAEVHVLPPVAPWI